METQENFWNIKVIIVILIAVGAVLIAGYQGSQYFSSNDQVIEESVEMVSEEESDIEVEDIDVGTGGAVSAPKAPSASVPVDFYITCKVKNQDKTVFKAGSYLSFELQIWDRTRNNNMGNSSEFYVDWSNPVEPRKSSTKEAQFKLPELGSFTARPQVTRLATGASVSLACPTIVVSQ